MYRDQLQAWFDQHRGRLSQMESNHMQRLIDYLDVVKTPHSDAGDIDHLRHDFKSFYQQYDQRRAKNFESTFRGPMAAWYRQL
jgi:ferritin